MGLEHLIPIIGVAVGWGLSEFSNAFQGRTARVRAVRKAISTLYKINCEMLQVKISQEFYKNNFPKDVAQWERGRKRAFEKFFDNSDEALQKIDKAISLIAEYYPLLSFRLSEAIQKYRFLCDRSLESFTNDSETYIKMLSGFEMGQMVSQYSVEKIVLNLAFRSDIFLWMSLKKDIKNFKKNIKADDLVHFSQILDKSRSNKPIQPTAESAAD